MMSLFQKATWDARELARSLVYEGYLYVYEWYDEHTQSLFIKLRHTRNRNTITVQVHGSEWWAAKNGKTIKHS